MRPEVCKTMSLVLLAGCGGLSRVEVPAPDDREVVVGYGTQTRPEVTGSVASVSPDETDTRTARVVNMLDGRVPGLTVIRLPNGKAHCRSAGSAPSAGEASRSS